MKGFYIMVNEKVKLHLDKSASRYKCASLAYEHNFYDESVSLAYYAVFHAISAVLAIKDIEFKTHKSLLSFFNQHYVNTGEIGSISSRALIMLFEGRNNCEYDPSILEGKEGAEAALKYADIAMKDVLDYIKNQ